MSQGVISSERMLFEPKVVNEGVEYLQYIECRPTNQITEDGSVDIHIKASGSQYLELQRRLLHVKVKVEKEDGSNLEEAVMVTTVILWMQSLFNEVDVYFQQKLVSSSGTNYAYKAYMDVLLNFSEDAEKSQIQTQLFYNASAGLFDQTIVTEVPLNQGLILRQNLVKNSQLVDMYGPIFADTFNMSKYLLNKGYVCLKLFQSKHDFRLMSSVAGKKYKVIITEVMLKAAMVGIHPDILKSHACTLKDKPAIYPLNRIDVKTFVVPKGQ